MGKCDNLASEVHRAARRRGLNQHGIEDRPIEPPARLLGMEYELVACKPRISPCRHSAIGRAMPGRDERVPYPEMDEDESDRRRHRLSDARMASYGAIDQANPKIRCEIGQ
jgi:hypothetical protein